MQEFKVKNVVMGIQFETCENYLKFIDIVKEKKIRVIQVEAGQKINIEKYLYFDVLWPNSNHKITNNVLNNNSLVCKLVYKDFSMLFTGDIEEIAEKEILKEYKNSNVLESNVLKVGHHGSKTSTTNEFLDRVRPQIALIGVGENNTFGHPNSDILERLESLRY